MDMITQEVLLGLLANQGPVVPALAFQSSSIAHESATVVAPSDIEDGDFGILIDYQGKTSAGAPTSVTPSGWTSIESLSTTATTNHSRMNVSYKKLTAADAGATITGIAAGDWGGKVLLVFRPGVAIGTVSPSTFNTFTQASNGQDPASQSVSASGHAPCVVIGAIASNSSNSFSTETPAFDDEIVAGSGGFGSPVLVGYKVYASTASNHTVDSISHGTGMIFTSGYVAIS